MSIIHDKFLKEIEDSSEELFIYRGQCNHSWTLKSRISNRFETYPEPSIPNEQRLTIYHRNLINGAKKRGFDFDSGRPLNEMELLAKLQHFGASTFLLDFTWDALTALWFACELGIEGKDNDGKVFVLNLEDLQPISFNNDDNIEKIVEKARGGGFYYWEPTLFTDAKIRVTQQKSIFILDTNNFNEIKYEREPITIKASDKEVILKELESLFGINEDKLFGDIYGFARSHGKDKPIPKTRNIQTYLYKGFHLLAEGQKHLHKRNFSLFKNNLKEAELFYSRYIKNKKTDIYGSIYHTRANVRVDIRKFPEAIEDYSRAINSQNEYSRLNHISPSIKIALYISRGNCQHALKEFEKAIEDYNFAECVINNTQLGYNLDYHCSTLYYARGSAKERLGYFDEALEDFEKAKLKGNKEALYAKGFTLIQQGKLQEARNYILRAKEHRYLGKESIERNFSSLEEIIRKVEDYQFKVSIDNLKAEFRNVELFKSSQNDNRVLSTIVTGYSGLRGNMGVNPDEAYETNFYLVGTTGFPGIMGFKLIVKL